MSLESILLRAVARSKRSGWIRARSPEPSIPRQRFFCRAAHGSLGSGALPSESPFPGPGSDVRSVGAAHSLPSTPSARRQQQAKHSLPFRFSAGIGEAWREQGGTEEPGTSGDPRGRGPAHAPRSPCASPIRVFHRSSCGQGDGNKPRDPTRERSGIPGGCSACRDPRFTLRRPDPMLGCQWDSGV